MLVSLRIYCHYDSRPSDDWTVNFEFDGITSIESVQLDNITDAMVPAMAAAMLNNAIIDRFVWSTWIADSEIYDPESVRTIPVGVPGDRAFSLTSPVDDDLAYLSRKTASYGKPGRTFWKGWLLVANVTADGGAWRLFDIDVEQFEDYVTAIYLAAATEGQLVMAGVSLTSITYPATPEGVKQIPVRNYQSTPAIRPVTLMTGLYPTERQAKQ